MNSDLCGWHTALWATWKGGHEIGRARVGSQATHREPQTVHSQFPRLDSVLMSWIVTTRCGFSEPTCAGGQGQDAPYVLKAGAEFLITPVKKCL